MSHAKKCTHKFIVFIHSFLEMSQYIYWVIVIMHTFEEGVFESYSRRHIVTLNKSSSLSNTSKAQISPSFNLLSNKNSLHPKTTSNCLWELASVSTFQVLPCSTKSVAVPSLCRYGLANSAGMTWSVHDL